MNGWASGITEVFPGDALCLFPPPNHRRPTALAKIAIALVRVGIPRVPPVVPGYSGAQRGSLLIDPFAGPDRFSTHRHTANNALAAGLPHAPPIVLLRLSSTMLLTL